MHEHVKCNCNLRALYHKTAPLITWRINGILLKLIPLVIPKHRSIVCARNWLMLHRINYDFVPWFRVDINYFSAIKNLRKGN